MDSFGEFKLLVRAWLALLAARPKHESTVCYLEFKKAERPVMRSVLAYLRLHAIDGEHPFTDHERQEHLAFVAKSLDARDACDALDDYYKKRHLHFFRHALGLLGKLQIRTHQDLLRVWGKSSRLVNVSCARENWSETPGRWKACLCRSLFTKVGMTIF